MLEDTLESMKNSLKVLDSLLGAFGKSLGVTRRLYLSTITLGNYRPILREVQDTVCT